MNLNKLFEMQRELDEHIIREKELEGQDLLPKKILALQVELGELANEWRGFKFWSNDQEPRRFKMLEEFVDCLHFAISIALELGIEELPEIKEARSGNLEPLETFLALFSVSGIPLMNGGAKHWLTFLVGLLALGEMLGFTFEEIEAAYIAKNRVNHQRQDGGY